MIQHPIPQNVTGYQFRLIGDMTIKQFIFLSGGVAGAIFFYYTNLFSFLKWFFVITSGITGFAIAFLPLEERPLDQWIINYIKAIYRPTRYAWRKTNETPAYLTFTPKTDTLLPSDMEEISRQAAIRREQGLRSFLVTLPQDTVNADAKENQLITSINALFIQTSYTPTTSYTTTATFNINAATPAPIQPAAPEPISQAKPTKPNRIHDQTIPSGVITLEAIKVEKETVNPVVNDVATTNPELNTTDTHATTTIPITDPITSAVAATTDAGLPFPSTPTTPNTLVGMVLNQQGKIVDNAIIEVIDESGLPVRATKTNQLGQFFSTTPLKRGVYHITVDKPGLSFDTIEINLTGNIVAPLRIQAKPDSN